MDHYFGYQNCMVTFFLKEEHEMDFIDVECTGGKCFIVQDTDKLTVTGT